MHKNKGLQYVINVMQKPQYSVFSKKERKKERLRPTIWYSALRWCNTPQPHTIFQYNKKSTKL